MQAHPAPRGLASYVFAYSLNCYSLKPISVVLDGLEPSIDWVPVFIEDRAGAFAAGPQDYEK